MTGTSIGPASLDPRPWTPRAVRAGEWTVTALLDGWMRLDGGAMWGVVPKAIWGELTPAREDNTILLALRPFLARKEDRVVVIEVGIGGRWEERWRSIYAIERPDTLESTLRACGVAPEDVTDVVLSHCHFDHAGAAVVEEEGELRPLFPRARHHLPEVELEVALRPDHVRRASYRADDVEPLLRAGLVRTYGGDAELLPGIRAYEAAGHSDGVSVITIGEGEPAEDAPPAIFLADVVPTAHHVQPPYIMAYDVDVTRSFESRSRWLARTAEEGWTALFYHDPDHAFGRLCRDGRRYAVEALEGEPVPAR